MIPAQWLKPGGGILASVHVAELSSKCVCHPSLRVFIRGTLDLDTCPTRQRELCPQLLFLPPKIQIILINRMEL